MRAWLQKQKKKEDAKNASQTAIPTVAASAGADSQQTADLADKPVESVEVVPRVEETVDQAVAPAEPKESESRQITDVPISQSVEVTYQT
jgi:zinc finger CCCH domain-containing protein 13